MNAYAMWIDTRDGKKRYVIIAKDFDTALRHGKSLGEVTTIMKDDCDAVFVLDSPQ